MMGSCLLACCYHGLPFVDQALDAFLFGGQIAIEEFLKESLLPFLLLGRCAVSHLNDLFLQVLSRVNIDS
jgi:hypothetical protein